MRRTRARRFEARTLRARAREEETLRSPLPQIGSGRKSIICHVGSSADERLRRSSLLLFLHPGFLSFVSKAAEMSKG